MSDHASSVLIREAVQGRDRGALSRQDRQFATSFDRLVYTQIWEDPAVDMAAMELRPGHRVATICSAGCNALSYLTAADSVEVTAIDLNFSHLALAGLKRAAFRTAGSHADIESFLILAAGERNRALYRDKIAGALPDDMRAYWDGGRKPRHEDFVSGFFRKGLLGTAIGICALLARLSGIKLEDALRLDNADLQRQWARTHIRPVIEGRLLSLFFSLQQPLFLLGIPPRQFGLLCEGQPRRMPSVLADRVEQLAGVAKSSENYFLWQAFGRGYAPGVQRALPPYLTADNFETVRNRLDNLNLVHGSFTTFLAEREASSLDRYVLLDAQDWMDGPTLTALWGQISRTARPGARVIFRTAGTTPPFPTQGNREAWRGWQRLDQLSDDLHGRDRSGIYGGFHVYEMVG